jgi:ribonuclease HI
LGRTACTRFAKRNTHDPAGGVFLGDTFGSMTERGTSAGDGSGPKTRYHLLTTDGGIVADQPGKMAGEAAIGVVLKAPLEEISEPIGPAKDHHVAEYRALIRGLEAARSRGIGHLRVCLDSALLVNQLSGTSKVKAEHLKPLHEQAVSLIQQFADIKITWVPRKANAEADALASTPLGPLRPETFNPRTSARIAPSLRSSAQPVRSTSRPLPTSPERERGARRILKQLAASHYSCHGDALPL